jgi:hypothetical protein
MQRYISFSERNQVMMGIRGKSDEWNETMVDAEPGNE